MNYYIEALKKYAEFSGRATRAEYWYFILFNIIFSIGFSLLDALLGSVSTPGLFSGLYGLIVLVPSIAVTVRRLHDTNNNGFWILILFIPLIGVIYILFQMLQDSWPGDNPYGPNKQHHQL